MARVEIDLPWDLESVDFTDLNPNTTVALPVSRQLDWMTETHDTLPDDSEYGRVFLAAGLLKQKFPDTPFEVCFNQALIWERG